LISRGTFRGPPGRAQPQHIAEPCVSAMRFTQGLSETFVRVRALLQTV
jgi:hypothetical protein